jgi:hypothetical protein
MLAVDNPPILRPLARPTACLPPPCPCSYNKQVLRVFPFPLTITAFQFLVGAVLASAMWLVGLHKKPEGNFVDTVSWRCCRCRWRRLQW